MAGLEQDDLYGTAIPGHPRQLIRRRHPRYSTADNCNPLHHLSKSSVQKKMRRSEPPHRPSRQPILSRALLPHPPSRQIAPTRPPPAPSPAPANRSNSQPARASIQVFAPSLLTQCRCRTEFRRDRRENPPAASRRQRVLPL